MPGRNRPQSRTRHAARLDELLAAIDGDGALFALLLQTFRDELPHRTEDVRAAFACDDRVAAERALHVLSGMVSQFGAAAALTLGEAERLARRGELALAASRWDEAEIQLQQLDQAVAEQLQR